MIFPLACLAVIPLPGTLVVARADPTAQEHRCAAEGKRLISMPVSARKSIIEERSRELNRLQKVLEGANIKLGSVVADIHSKSARRLLERLAAGETMDDSEEISKLLHKSLLNLSCVPAPPSCGRR